LAEAVDGGGEAGAPVLELAFRALGPTPSRFEFVAVAAAIRRSGDREALELFGLSPEPDPDPVFDRERSAAVRELAGRYGIDGFVALDLYTEVLAPGWSPFPVPPAA
jgi:hypothetical protein